MTKLWGVILVLISAVAFGAMPILANLAYADGATPLTLLFVRFSSAALLMLALMAVRREPIPRGKVLLGLIALGGLGYVGQSMAYFTALTFASAGLVALLLYLYPVGVTILAVIFLKEPFTRTKAIALGLSLFGSVLTIGGIGDGRPEGILLGITAALIYSAYITFGSLITRTVSAIQSTTVVISSAAVVYTVINLLQGPTFPRSIDGWAALLAIALISTVLAILAFFAGMTRLGPTNAALLSTVEPIVSVLLGALILSEILTAPRILGGVLILGAVILLTRGAVRVESEPPI
ncbi:MAG: DMT family transporter [Anaerolineae bacterium]